MIRLTTAGINHERLASRTRPLSLRLAPYLEVVAVMDPVTVDAWEQVHNIWQEFCQTWEVRPYLLIDALGPDRHVQLRVGKRRDDDALGGAWRYTSTTHNVGTMRELALALWAACDFVDAANPKWASFPPAHELRPVESFVKDRNASE